MGGIRDLAAATGFSTSTISRALHHDPSISRATRDRILRKAKEMRYEPNPYVCQLMSSLRRGISSKFSGNLGLIWSGRQPAKGAEPRLLQMRRGAMERAEELGYSMSEFSRTHQSTESLRRILWNRGIRGILIASPAPSVDKVYFRFDPKNFACISLGWGLVHPKLHSIRFDYYQAVQMALHEARRPFRARVAAIWDLKADRRAQYTARASFLAHHAGGPLLAQKLFLDFRDITPKKTVALFKKHDVQCVIVESGVKFPTWLHDVIPEKNIIWLRDPHPVNCFGWIDTQNEFMGRWGVNLLTGQLLHNEYGAPEVCQTLLVPPRWMDGG